MIDRFIDGYAAGLTPNPCIDCNRYIKFERLYDRAELMGCDYIATGHYARIVREGERYLLKRALDPTKDQSYVLYSMTQRQLSHTLFPLGEIKKTEVRELAAASGFINADKPDSQDICFVPDGDYAAAIERLSGRCFPPGNFVDREGRILGRHAGIIRYTVGQHKGLGVSLGSKRYVCLIRPESGDIVLGDREELGRRELTVSDFNWISGEAPTGEIRCSVMTRYRRAEQTATAYMDGDGTVRIVFDEPCYLASPGQAAVLYDGDVVLGGGRIERFS